jgi:hypothetical protein
MSKGRHIHNQQEMHWNSSHRYVLESMEAEVQTKVNAMLFNWLLTFAIRMGFHIGQTALNAAAVMHEGEAKVDLFQFVRAHNALEKMDSRDL